MLEYKGYNIIVEPEYKSKTEKIRLTICARSMIKQIRHLKDAWRNLT